MWFEKLTGFKETSPKDVRENLVIEGDTFVSKVNNRRFTFGELQIPTLGELKMLSPSKESYDDRITVEEIVADVKGLHCQLSNEHALFQAASQFNLLEMIGPDVSPEEGIGRYELDHTQGPVCAMACGAGTIFRNYFVEVDGQIGQSFDKQIDCLELVSKELKNPELDLWNMQNGYAMISEKGLLIINKNLASRSPVEREKLKDQLKVGIQWNTEVTQSTSKHKVSQIYCSALPVAYCHAETFYWESFSRVILEALYEATLYAGLINFEQTNSRQVFLTLVGGGAFGNEEHWIVESLFKSIAKFRKTPLQLKIVSYGQSNETIANCIQEL